jgi:hypothetical protein
MSHNKIWGMWQRKKINECGVAWTKRKRGEEEEKGERRNKHEVVAQKS